LHERLRDQHGGESFQAMFLAMRLALTLLRGFVETGGTLLMAGEDRAGADFPFDAYTINCVAGCSAPS
jgi:hypothetical protein